MQVQFETPKLIKPGFLHRTTLASTTEKSAKKYEFCFSFEENRVFTNQFRIKNEETKILWQNILKNHHKHGWKYRKTLEINYRWCKNITNESIKAFAQKIPLYFADLKCLSLDLSGCTQVTSVAYKNLVSSICRNLSNLEKLNLNFSWIVDIKDKDLGFLVVQLGNLSNLKSLTLNFLCCQKITDKGLELFGIQIRRLLHKLNRLDIRFGGCTTPFRNYKCNHISETGMQSLGLDIARLPKLKSFSFTMQLSDHVRDAGLTSFVFSLTERLTNLVQLSLNFQECPSITDASLPILGTGISTNLKALQKLLICFSGCGGTTDEGAANLMQLIQENLPSLQHLVVKGRSDGLVQ